MEEKKLTLDYELCNYIEATQYDLDAIRQLLIQMGSNTPKDVMDYWRDEYLNKSREYTVAKHEIETAIKESGIVEEGKDFSWNLDFSTREVTITQ